MTWAGTKPISKIVGSIILARFGDSWVGSASNGSFVAPAWLAVVAEAELEDLSSGVSTTSWDHVWVQVKTEDWQSVAENILLDSGYDAMHEWIRNSIFCQDSPTSGNVAA